MLYAREAEDEEDRSKKILAYLCVNLKCGMFDGAHSISMRHSGPNCILCPA